MSAAASLSYLYRYTFASDLAADGDALGLRLATSGGAEPNPYFFHGRLAYPKEMADQLLTLAQIVNSRFFLPNLGRLTDPVVTANDQVLRFEGFSSCCGVYARADFRADAFEADLHGRGTTNVDFNSAMRTSLGRIRQQDKVSLRVGADHLALAQNGAEVIEKKVKLPVRWIKGFTEVQAYQRQLKPCLEVGGAEAKQFLSGLPRGAGPKQPSYVTPVGRGLRLSQRPSGGAVRVMGTERLRLLEPLASSARSLRILSDDGAGVSAWELAFASGRFVLMVTPEVSRGFSGEGQMLVRLAGREWERALPLVRAELAWQARIRVDAVAARTSLSAAAVDEALGVLGARGLVGYDMAESAYFHRELPFDLEAVESLQPRLKEARRLVAENKVRVTERNAQGATLSAIVIVQGTGVEHRVRLLPAGDRCTCPWFSKHQGGRGACKHVLAARMVVDGDDESGHAAAPGSVP